MFICIRYQVTFLQAIEAASHQKGNHQAKARSDMWYHRWVLPDMWYHHWVLTDMWYHHWVLPDMWYHHCALPDIWSPPCTATVFAKRMNSELSPDSSVTSFCLRVQTAAFACLSQPLWWEAIVLSPVILGQNQKRCLGAAKPHLINALSLQGY